MKAQVKFGRIAGISIGLHYSWSIVAVLIALSLVQHFHAVDPQWSRTAVWMAAAVTSELLFVALLLHELAHSLMAKARGLRVRAITLFALGGVSQIESEARDAKSEFWIAIAGPITSVVTGLVLLGTWQTRDSHARMAGVLYERCLRWGDGALSTRSMGQRTRLSLLPAKLSGKISAAAPLTLQAWLL